MNGPSEIDRFREAFRSKQTLLARQHALLDPVERLKDGAEREKALGAFSEQKLQIDRFREAFGSRQTRAPSFAPRRPCVSTRGPPAVTRNDAPGGQAAPLMSSEAPFSISHLESVESGAATLPPSRAPSRITCPSTEGDCQPSHRAADPPVEELQGRWTNELTEFRRVSIPSAFQVTGLTVSPSDDSAVARALQRRSSLPVVSVRTQWVASAREDKPGALTRWLASS